jgi:short-subunit dehydrogenase
MSDWGNKVVLVTGGSAGLGRAIASQFAQCGATVVIAARDQDRLEAAATSIEGLGSRCHSVVADVTSDEDVRRLVASVVDQHGRLDVLVNAAGKSARGAIEETTVDDFQQLLDLNFLATVRCTSTALPYLKQTQGHLINIGSLASKVAARYLAGYPASKHAVAAYSQQLRLELEPAGLHVLLVCPGPIARDDVEVRYSAQAEDLPDEARRPGAGARLSALDPDRLAARIVRACERRQRELVVPGKSRLLFALSQLSPRLGDWLLKKFT